MAIAPLILKAQLVEDGEEEYILVDRTPFRFGRRPENDVQIPRPDISGVHAEIVERDGAWMLLDRGSTNGTFINGKRIAEMTRLGIGDVVHFATKGYEVVPEAGQEPNLFATKVINSPDEIKGMIDLLKIVNEQRTYPFYQPIIEIAGGRTIGWESLGRASSEEGPVSLASLFRLASMNKIESKLSVRFRESARLCAECGHCWPKDERLLLFFNLHPAEIHDAQFLNSLREFARTELHQTFHVVIEMPESWVCNSQQMQELVKEIRELGMQVAYDDFGQGQSRIPDLISVPPDYLKLDRELIADLGNHRIKHGLVKAIVDACRALNVQTLGEGIETQEELQACADMQIDLGQGYLLGRPKPAYELFSANRSELPGTCPFVRLDILPK